MNSSDPAGRQDMMTAELGERLRALRAKAGVTRRQLAQKSGTSERYLAHLEAGTGNPTVTVLAALATALDVAMPELLPQGGERLTIHERLAAAMRRLSRERLGGLAQWLDTPGPAGSEKHGRIVLVGLRGAGKSSLGKGLAQRLGMPFVEMSKEVETLYGGNIGLLIELSGQAALKRYEREAWEQIYRGHQQAVIAASGGVVADGPLYERLLQTAHSIWLEARPEDHMSRVMAQGDLRPMSSNRAAMGDLNAILAARAADYARADERLPTSEQPEKETLNRLEAIARRMIKDAL